VIFLLLGIAMLLFAIVLLLFGFTSTGLTRENMCEGTKCVRSGVSVAVIVSSSSVIVVVVVVVVVVAVAVAAAAAAAALFDIHSLMLICQYVWCN